MSRIQRFVVAGVLAGLLLGSAAAVATGEAERQNEPDNPGMSVVDMSKVLMGGIRASGVD